MKKRGFFLISLLITVLFITSVFAQDVDSASNLFSFNENVTITKQVTGDIYSGGRSVKIKENVAGDIIVGAENLDISSSEVNGNIRTASKTLYINSRNVKNITSVAQYIDIDKNTTAKALYLSGEEINFKGACEGFYATGDIIIINGKIKGDLDVTCNEFIIAQDGDITGNIKVNAEKEPVVNSKISVDDINFTKIDTQKNQNSINKIIRVGTIITILAALLWGLVLYTLFKKFFINSDKVLAKEPLTVFLGGLGSFILLPLVSLLLFITVIGLPLGIISLITYFILVYVSPIICGIFIGRAMLKGKNPYLQVLSGVFIIRVLTILPYIGSFVWVVSSIITFGAIYYQCYKSIKYKEKVLIIDNK